VSDRLSDMFERQRGFMEMLREKGKLPDFPLDLTTKDGQGWVKRCAWDLVEELGEATHHLRNRLHYVGDHSELDTSSYKEELMDAYAFFMEVLILSGISEDEMYEEYCRKNGVVRRRLQEGY
jgi:hypothetical protein